MGVSEPPHLLERAVAGVELGISLRGRRVPVSHENAQAVDVVRQQVTTEQRFCIQFGVELKRPAHRSQSWIGRPVRLALRGGYVIVDSGIASIPRVSCTRLSSGCRRRPRDARWGIGWLAVGLGFKRCLGKRSTRRSTRSDLPSSGDQLEVASFRCSCRILRLSGPRGRHRLRRGPAVSARLDDAASTSR